MQTNGSVDEERLRVTLAAVVVLEVSGICGCGREKG